MTGGDQQAFAPPQVAPTDGGGPDDDHVVVLDGVGKSFRSFVAVERADVVIRRGEFFSLLGPSGCGKTTLLKIIAGFEQPTRGRVLLEGIDVSGVPPHKRNVNTVFQQYALFPHMSVRDNVAFGLRAKGLPQSVARGRASEMLDVVRLGEFVNRRPAQLSGGQQQRVALARALVNLPSALLLDEPLAALDLKLRESMQIELKRIQREVGITFIFVTHDQGEALTMSDRIAVMSRGTVEQIGTPEEIYSAPASIFVAGFIGSANLLPGTLRSVEAQTACVVLDCGPEVEGVVASDDGLAIGEPATVMIRPERLVVSDGAADPQRSLSGVIRGVIFQGAESRIIVHLADHTEVIVNAGSDDVAGRLATGDEVTLTWTGTATRVLPGRSAVVGATTTDVDEVEASLDGRYGSSDAGTGDPERSGGLGRRVVLVGGALLGAAAVVGGVLAFTGGGNSTAGPQDGDTDRAGGVGNSTLGSGDSALRILTWQAYIDPTEDGVAGTVDRFQDDTGVDVTYSEDFSDNNEVYNRELQPVLGTGAAIDYDIIVPTNWLAARLKTLGWLEPLPIDLIPNRVNLEDRFLNQRWDFGALWSLPWQAGITGIAYDPNLTGRDLVSVTDLFDPEFKGKIGLLTEMRDTVGLVMLAMGADPRRVDVDGAMAALERIDEEKRKGQIRAFTGNEYLRSLESGDFVACLAWSGDIVQLQYDRPEIQFVIPEEGGISWYDTMVIPKGASNGVAAAEWMNYVYDPVKAARITNWVQYVPVVKGVRDELLKMGGDAAELADNPILFPDEETAARLNVFADLPDDVDAELSERFLDITGG